MYRGTVDRNHSTKINWQFDEPVTQMSEDGPLALMTAVVAAVKRHKIRLLLWIGICIGLATFSALTISPSYQATATLVLEPRPSAAPVSSVTVVTSPLDVNQAETELQVIKSERLLAYVFDSLRLDKHPDFLVRPPNALDDLKSSIKEALINEPTRPSAEEDRRQIAFGQFAERIGVRRVGQSYVVDVSYTSSDPVLAPRVANATVSAYLWQSLAVKADKAKNGAEFVQGRVNALMAQVAAASAAVAAGSLPESATPDADARIIGAAVQPLGPSAPRRGLIIALGGIIGLATGFLILTLHQVFDHRIRTPEALTRATGIPCLATVPEVPRWSRFSRRSDAELFNLASSHPEGEFAAAIRDIRTSMMLPCTLEQGKDHEVVAVVSWTRDAGCTLICANLASIIHAGGSRVAIIDTDIRHEGRGVTDQMALAPVSVPMTLADALTSDAHVDQSMLLNRHGVAVLPARSSEPVRNQLAYLSNPKLSQIIDAVRSQSEVLLDLPPLSAGADARAAAQHADAVLLVVVAGRTTSSELASALHALRSVGANVIGTVLNRASA
jgi:polysaccharide biosynthesis transport protein